MFPVCGRTKLSNSFLIVAEPFVNTANTSTPALVEYMLSTVTVAFILPLWRRPRRFLSSLDVLLRLGGPRVVRNVALVYLLTDLSHTPSVPVIYAKIVFWSGNVSP